MGLGVILTTAVNAVVPLVLLIFLGYFLRSIGFLTKEFLNIGNKLVFHICLPCMLFVNVYDMERFSAISFPLVGYCVAVVLLLFVLGLATAVAVTKVPQRRGVIWQCTFRSNSAILGLPMAAALGGPEAAATAAVVSAFVVPLFNILAVISLSTFVNPSGSKKSGIRQAMRNIGKNPLIRGCVLGMVFLAFRELQLALFGQVVFSLKNDLKFLYTALNNLKSLATPLALIVMGGQFEFSAVTGLHREILAGTLWRTVLAPVLGIGGAIALTAAGVLTCGVNEYPTLLAMFGSPAAVSSAVMAGAMENDEQLATQLVVWSSLVSIGTIFLTVCLLMGAGLLAV